MSNWFFSLQLRLTLGFAVVLALTLGSVSAYIGYSANREVDKIAQLRDRAIRSRTEQTLSHFYAANGGWEGLQSAIERMGFLTGRRLTVLNDGGVVVGDSFGGRDLDYAKIAAHRKRTPILQDDRPVGSVVFGPFDVVKVPPDRLRPRFREPPPTRFAEATNQSLLWAGLAAGAGGIMLVSLVSRRALRSVRTLNAAARSLGRGDLSQRVPTDGRDEMGELSRTFNSMAEGLERAEKQRRSLVADVAHELRTPLTNVQGYVEAVRDGVLKPDSATIETIHQQVLYLARLMEDLKFLAETEAEDFRLRTEIYSMVEVVQRTVEAFRPSAEAKDVTISVDAAPGLPLVKMDRTRITQVLNNLLSNAIRHTPGGGEVTVSAEAVDRSSVRVVVSDSGQGIPPEDLPFVFERFYRADPSRTRSTGGVGLGLTIAKQLVEAHDGAISAANTPGHGSRFVIDLPVSGSAA